MNFSAENLTQLSNDDLRALQAGDYTRVSNAGLQQLSGVSSTNNTYRAKQSTNVTNNANAMNEAQKNTPKNAPLSTVLRRESLGFLEGALNFTGDLGNLALNALNHLALSPLYAVQGKRTPPIGKVFLPVNILSDRERTSPSAKLGRFVGEIAPAAVLPESKIAQGLTSGANASNTITRFLTRHLPRLADSGINGATQGAIFNRSAERDSPLSKGILEGAALGAGAHALLGAPAGLLETYLQRLGKKSRLSSNAIRTPEEVNALRQTLGEDLPVNAVDLFNLPRRTRMVANFFKDLPLSGSNQQAEKLRHTANTETRAFLEKLLGSSTESGVADDLIQSLRGHAKTHRKVAEELFRNLDERATQAGIKVAPHYLQKTARALLLDDQKALFPQLSERTRQALNALRKKSAYQPSFSELHFAHSDVTRLISELQRKGELREVRSLSTLRDSLVTDLENSLNQYNQRDLLRDWQAARGYFKENVAPYRKSYFYGLFDEGKGRKQLFDKLTSDEHSGVFNHLTPAEKEKLLYLRVAPRVRQATEHDPLTATDKLVNAYEKLSPTLRNKLLTATQRAQFERLAAMAKLVPPASVRPPRLNFWRLGEIGGLGYLLASHMISPLTMGGGLLANRAVMKRLSSSRLAQAYARQSVGNPALHAKLAKGVSAPLAYTLQKKKNKK